MFRTRFSGVKSSEKAEMTRVLIVPGPRIENVCRNVPVSAGESSGLGAGRSKTNDRRVKSELGLEANVIRGRTISVVVTGSIMTVELGTEVLKLSVGRETFTGRPRRCRWRRWWCGGCRSGAWRERRRRRG